MNTRELSSLRKIMMLALLGSLIQVAAGCATLPPLKNEIPLAGNDISMSTQDPGLTKLIIFNSAGRMMYLGRHKMNVYLNGKGVAQLRAHNYVQLVVPRGKYKVDLVHVHDLLFRSSHVVELNAPDTYLEVFPTIDSSRARLVSELPKNFTDNFRPAD